MLNCAAAQPAAFAYGGILCFRRHLAGTSCMYVHHGRPAAFPNKKNFSQRHRLPFSPLGFFRCSAFDSASCIVQIMDVQCNDDSSPCHLPFPSTAYVLLASLGAHVKYLPHRSGKAALQHLAL